MFPKNPTRPYISIFLIIAIFLSLADFVLGDEKSIQCYCQDFDLPNSPKPTARTTDPFACKDGKVDCPTDDNVIKGHCIKRVYEITAPPDKKGTFVRKHCGAAAYSLNCTSVPLKGSETGTLTLCNCKGNLCNDSVKISPATTTTFVILVLPLILTLALANPGARCSFSTGYECK